MKNILVTSDFSKNANVAIRYAIRLSKLMNYKLVVFHCVFQSPYTVIKAKQENRLEDYIKKDEEEKTKLLKKSVLDAYKYLGYSKIPGSTTVFASFNPLFIEKTIEVANTYNAAFIIMGTHGASGINKVLFGSNTSIMISKSSIPVLAIPENYRYKKIKTILYSSDLENFSNEIKKVIEFAKPLNAEINVLYLDYGTDYGNENISTATEFINTTNYPKINLLKKEATNKPLLEQVKKYMDDHNQQWLVMFTKKRSFWTKIISGSKTVEYSMKLTVPLLSIKKENN